MLFNSINFLLFFPIVAILFYVLPHKFRWLHLLIASCIFYMFFIPEYILILIGIILIDFLAAIYIDKSEQKNKKKYLIISILATVLLLFYFKYFNFFTQNLHDFFALFGVNFNNKVHDIILPIGLSFHTFQSLSYVIEVYRGNQKAERHFGIYSLYVLFFPQLVTGPIERPQNLLTQLREKIKLNYSNLAQGFRLIIFGLFIKMVVADNLGEYVNMIYKEPEIYNSLSILIGLFFYSFQIYCDFFGYSTIAVGSALVLGYKLMDNFKNPYFSKSIGEFWQRWHISLSTWFRDYVYFSLGGNKVKIPRWSINILIVFVLSGFWHGANWTFILWGVLHGIIYLLESLFNRFIKIKAVTNQVVNAIISFFKVLKTFVLISFIWILFRAENLEKVQLILKSLVSNFNLKDDFLIDSKIWIFLGFFILLDSILFNNRFDLWCKTKNVFLRWSVYSVMIFLIILFSNVENFPFIYFQF